MDFIYFYVKLTDDALGGSTLYWDDFNEPDSFMISELHLTKNPNSGKWEATLQKLGDARFELVCVTPHEKRTKNGVSGSVTKNENIYIFKRRDEMELVDFDQ